MVLGGAEKTPPSTTASAAASNSSQPQIQEQPDSGCYYGILIPFRIYWYTHQTTILQYQYYQYCYHYFHYAYYFYYCFRHLALDRPSALLTGNMENSKNNKIVKNSDC